MTKQEVAFKNVLKSKISRKPIDLTGVEVSVQDDKILVKKDANAVFIHKIPQVDSKIENQTYWVEGTDKALCGTQFRLVLNAVSGVKTKFVKKIKLNGVGYKVEQKDKDTLQFKIGYSHLVDVTIRTNVEVKVESPTTLTLLSSDKREVGFLARQLSELKKYNVYTGCGLLIDGKSYRRKATKAKK